MVDTYFRLVTTKSKDFNRASTERVLRKHGHLLPENSLKEVEPLISDSDKLKREQKAIKRKSRAQEVDAKTFKETISSLLNPIKNIKNEEKLEKKITKKKNELPIVRYVYNRNGHFYFFKEEILRYNTTRDDTPIEKTKQVCQAPHCNNKRSCITRKTNIPICWKKSCYNTMK